MENALRLVIIFLWCVCFGFFSIMGYLDDTMTAQKTTAILFGLLASLGVYCGIEWFTKSKEPQSLHEVGKETGRRDDPPYAVNASEQTLSGIQAYPTVTTPPSWDNIEEPHPQTNNPAVSSKSL